MPHIPGRQTLLHLVLTEWHVGSSDSKSLADIIPLRTAITSLRRKNKVGVKTSLSSPLLSFPSLHSLLFHTSSCAKTACSSRPSAKTCHI